MIRMQELTDDFNAKNPDITLEWVTLEENVLRQRVTTDIATKGGQYDVMTIGTYEVPIWAKQGWLVPLDDLPDELRRRRPAAADPQRPVGRRQALCRAVLRRSLDGDVPHRPGREGRARDARRSPPGDIKAAAAAMTDKDNEVYGICLRGKPGWGENMAFLTTMANSYGARWFDMDWKPQFDSPEWKDALTTTST